MTFTRRLYVRKGDPGRNEPYGVAVINTQTNTRVTTVPLANGWGGVAVNTTTNRVYVTNGPSNDVSILDGTPGSRTENRIVATAAAGRSPQIVGVNPLSNRVYAANQDSWTVSVLLDQAAATHFSVSAPASSVAGSPVNVTVTARNALFNTTATGYRGTVRFTSTDGAATLPSNYTFAPGDNGVRSFSVTLRTAGSRTVTVTDTTSSAVTGSATILVTPAAASTFSVSAFPSPVTAGEPGGLVVTARDAFGNMATGYRGTIRFSSTDPLAKGPRNYAFTPADNGTHVFGAELRTAGTHSITATDTSNTAITGSQTGIVVNPAAAAFLFLEAPASTTPDAPLDVTLYAFDEFFNLATGYRGRVTFTSTDEAATLPADYIFGADDPGYHTFFGETVFRTPGLQDIYVTDTANGTLVGFAQVLVEPGRAPGGGLPGRDLLDAVFALWDREQKSAGR